LQQTVGRRMGRTDSMILHCRKRLGSIPDHRATSVDRVTALESAFTGFAERTTDAVVTPSVGTTFDSVAEAYEFYNLYSWELGFGIRYAKARRNVAGGKCMQEIVCYCAVRNLCVLIRLRRIDNFLCSMPHY
jgi:hypothetical protein